MGSQETVRTQENNEAPKQELKDLVEEMKSLDVKYDQMGLAATRQWKALNEKFENLQDKLTSTEKEELEAQLNQIQELLDKGLDRKLQGGTIDYDIPELQEGDIDAKYRLETLLTEDPALKRYKLSVGDPYLQSKGASFYIKNEKGVVLGAFRPTALNIQGTYLSDKTLRQTVLGRAREAERAEKNPRLLSPGEGILNVGKAEVKVHFTSLLEAGVVPLDADPNEVINKWLGVAFKEGGIAYAGGILHFPSGAKVDITVGAASVAEQINWVLRVDDRKGRVYEHEFQGPRLLSSQRKD